MRAMLWILVVGALVFAGCGGDEPQAEAEPSPAATDEPKPEATPDPKPEVRKLVVDWLDAAAQGDSARVCELTAPSERRRFAELAGSCVAAYEGSGGTPQQQARGRRLLARSRPDVITVYKAGSVSKARFATIEIEHKRHGYYMTIYALEEGGRWGLVRKKRTGWKGIDGGH